MLELLLVVAWISAVVLSPVIATSKGRNGFAWAMAGLAFGPFSMLAIGLMEPASVQKREREHQLEQEREVKRMVQQKPASKKDDGSAAAVGALGLDLADDDT